MPARLIFVESNTSGSGMLALATARRIGFEPVLLTSDPERYAGLAEAAPVVVECETNSPAALRETVMRVGKDIAGVTTTSEFYLSCVARLAGLLGLPGNPLSAAQLCRHKEQTRLTLAKARIGQPRFGVVRHRDETDSVLARVGLPCVVKPVDESGSQNVVLCTTACQVHDHVQHVLTALVNARGQPAARTALLEEYLDGPEYSVEMFSCAGTAHCVGVTEKVVGGHPYFVESRHIYPAVLDADTAHRMVSEVRLALAATGVTEGPTHTEVKLLPDRVAVVEINMRLAGGMIPELVRLVDGVDLLEQQIRAAVGLPVDLTPKPRTDRHAGIAFVMTGRRGTVVEVSGVDAALREPGVHRVSVAARVHAQVAPPVNGYGRLGHVIATGSTPDAVHARLDRALNHITVTVTPDEPADDR